MKTLIAWLTRRQRCDCGGFKPPRAAVCFDCSLPPAVAVDEIAERRAGRHAA